ncbi:class I SAM-dependent methyltransferase [Pyrococcus kukulkanii]|uniref:Class I SAM-dependent methyltransferase n=1 Tax=Pyrococcus kukulkanii TaxID=1609559 RepID=A0ABV4T1S5_9EURY
MLLPDGIVGTVITTYTFHHVPDEEKWDTIREMPRILKPDGKIIVADVRRTGSSKRYNHRGAEENLQKARVGVPV